MDNARQYLSARMRERAIERVPVSDIIIEANWRDIRTSHVAPSFSSFAINPRTAPSKPEART